MLSPWARLLTILFLTTQMEKNEWEGKTDLFVLEE